MKIRKQENRNYWVTSDLHFSHKNVIRYSNRPFANVYEMDEALIHNWNSNVGVNDIVFNLGDFALCNQNKIIQILKRLNGIQYFIYGNHDAPMRKRAIRDFCRESGKIEIFCDTLECRFGKYHLFMSHYGHRVWNKSHHGALHFYGHSHGSPPGIGKSVDVGIDSNELQTNYAPMRVEDVIEYLSHKDVHKIDHH